MSRLTEFELNLVRQAKTETSLGHIDASELMHSAGRARDAFVGRQLGRLFALSWLRGALTAADRGLSAAVRRRSRVRRTIRELARLDDTGLADIGIERSEIRAVSEALARGPNNDSDAPGLVSTWFTSLRRRMARERLARALSALDDRTLYDIGIERHEIPEAAAAAVSREMRTDEAKVTRPVPAGDPATTTVRSLTDATYKLIPVNSDRTGAGRVAA